MTTPPKPAGAGVIERATIAYNEIWQAAEGVDARTADAVRKKAMTAALVAAGVVAPAGNGEDVMELAKFVLRDWNKNTEEKWLSSGAIPYIVHALSDAGLLKGADSGDAGKMREALEPFMKSLAQYRADDGWCSADEPVWDYPINITLGQVWKLRAAYDALAYTPSSPAGDAKTKTTNGEKL